MNSTMNISRGSDHSSGYVSMIQVDGNPILPPIMTESRRAEMRRYRELAIRVETNQQFNKRERRIQFLQNQKEQEQINKEKDQMDSLINSSNIILNDNNNSSSINNKKTDLDQGPINKENDNRAPPSNEVAIQVTVEKEEDQNSCGNSNYTSNTSESEFEDFDKVDIPSPRSLNHSIKTKIPIPITSENDKENIQDYYEIPTNDNIEFKTITTNDDDVTATTTTQLFKKKYIPEIEQQGQNEEIEAMLNDSRRILVEDDNKSESMSLVSLDQEEEAQRREMEKEGINEDVGKINNGIIDENNSDISSSSSLENFLPASGRSSTETFIIERHNTTSDSDNNNEIYSPRKYFFSPPPGESGETSIVMFTNTNNNNNNDEDDDEDDISNSVSINSTNTQSTQYPENNNETITITNVTKNTKMMKLHHPNPRPSVYNCKRYFDSPISTPPSSAKSQNSESSSININNNNSSSNNNNTDDNTLKDDISFTSSNSPSLHSPNLSKNSKNITITLNSQTPRTPRTPPASNSTLNYDGQNEKENIMISPPIMTTPTKRNLSSSASSTSNNIYYKSPKNLGSPQLPRPSTHPSKRYFASPVSSRNSQNEITFQDSSNTTTYTPPPLSSPKSTSTIIATNLSAANCIARSGFKMSPSLRAMDFDHIYRGESKRELRIPPQALDPAMKPKFDRVSAAAKGYLVRRLLRTEKIQMIIQTIRDTVELVLKLHEEVPQLRVRNGTGIKPEDAELCRRLFQQLSGACTSFHDIFFKLTTTQRMAIISNDREKLKAKEFKSYMSRSRSGDSALGPKSKRNGNLSGRKISNATVKCLERRLTIHN